MRQTLSLLFVLSFVWSLSHGYEITVLPPVDDVPSRWTENPQDLDPVWKTTKEDITATLWLSATDAGLRLIIEVVDPEHSNDFARRELWRGDCVYLAIDGRGDSTNASDAKDEDDCFVVVGLGADGPELRVLEGGAPVSWAMEEDGRFITRDEVTSTTRYNLRFFWSGIGGGAGVSGHVGLAAIIAHKTKSGEDLAFGTAQTRGERQRQLERVAIGLPSESYMTVAWGRSALVQPGDVSETVVAFGGESCPSKARFSVEFGEKKDEIEHELAAGENLRFSVRIQEEDIRSFGVKLHVRPSFFPDADCAVERSEASDVLEYGGWAVLTPMEIRSLSSEMARLDDELTKALARDDLSEIETLYLTSVQLLLNELKGRRKLLDDPKWNEDAMTFVSGFYRVGLERRLRNCAPLLIAFISEYDGSLQFATLQLPPDWDPDKEYPLVVYLHGAGPQRPLDHLVTAVDTSGQDTLWEPKGELGDPDLSHPQRQCILLSPFARGTQFYVGAAEEDVWQAIELVEERLRVDPDRRYLTGFSMGASGAWRFAALRPDLWAGVSVASGFGDWSSTSDPSLRVSLSGMPVLVWCGELDGMYPAAQEFAANIQHSNPIQTYFVPNTPHTYPYDEYGRVLEWLFQYERGQPREVFEFNTGKARYPGPAGLRMVMDWSPNLTEKSRMVYRRDGQTLFVETVNAKGIVVQPALLGMDLRQPIRIVWNGKTGFDGLAGEEPVSIGEAPSRWFSPYGASLK